MNFIRSVFNIRIAALLFTFLFSQNSGSGGVGFGSYLLTSSKKQNY